MTRKLKKRESKSVPPVESTRLAGLGPLLPMGGVALVIVVSICLLESLRSRVSAAPEYNPALALKLEYPAGSEWVEQEEWLPRIQASIKLPSNKLMDESLLGNIAAQVQASGWVRSVQRVTRGVDGVIRVCCEYRRPIAMVLTNRGKYIPIDKEGVRLPEEYDRVDSNSGWMRIIGVQTDPPPVGRSYGEVSRSDSDAVAAVRLAALLFSQDDIANRISGIDVSNFNGRESKYRKHIRLWARDGRKIDWGSAIGSEVEEPGPADKLRNLVLWLKRGSPQAYVADLTIYWNGVAATAGQ